MLGRSKPPRAPSSVVLAVVLAAQLVAMPAGAGHDDDGHKGDGAVVTAAVSEAGEAPSPAAFPLAIGGPFELVDHFGNTRSSADFEGVFPLIFFGYAQCESICPVVFRTMLDAVDLLAEEGARLQPILITVDPEGEPPEVLRPAMEALHPRLLGMTGSSRQIAEVKKAFHVTSDLVGQNLKGRAVFAHGAYVYLMGPDGRFLTLFPPILDAPTLAEKLKAYLS